MDAHDLCELGDVGFGQIDVLLCLPQEVLGIGGGVGVVDGEVRGAAGRRLGEQLQHAVKGARAGACARDELDVGGAEADDGLHLEHARGPGGDARDAAAASEVGERIEHGEQGDALGHRFRAGEDFVDRGAASSGAGGFEDDEALGHGGVAGVEQADIGVGRFGLRDLDGLAGGVVHGAELRRDGDAEHGVGAAGGAGDRFEEHAGRRRGRGGAVAGLREELVELARVVGERVDEGAAAEDDVEGDDLDAVAGREIGRDAGGAVGDDGDWSLVVGRWSLGGVHRGMIARGAGGASP